MNTVCAGMVDTIFADVAQPDQARIVAINAHHFLKNQGHVVISIKVRFLSLDANYSPPCSSPFSFFFFFSVLQFVIWASKIVGKSYEPQVDLHCHLFCSMTGKTECTKWKVIRKVCLDRILRKTE